MINVIFNEVGVNYIPKQKETWDKYCKIIQWGRANPTRFLEDFVGLSFTDTQKYVLLSSWVPANVVWVCSRSSGKAGCLDTPVYVIENNKIIKKQLKDIKIGDTLINKDGKQTKVIQLHPIIIDDVYEVEFDDGEVIKCNKEHLWVVYDRVRDHLLTKKDQKLRVLSTEQMERTKVVSLNGVSRYSIPKVKPIEFNTIEELEIEPYLLGLWLGDGTSIGPRITCDAIDVEEQKRILESITKKGWTYEIKKYECTKDKRQSEIFIRHEKDKIDKNGKVRISWFCEQLRQLGMFNNKHIPEKYQYSSIQDRIDLLCGIYDSDGYADKNGRQKLSQVNKVIVEEVRNILDSLGIKNTLYYNKVWEGYEISSNVNGNNIPLFKLKRKLDRQKQLKRDRDRKYIKRVEKTSEKKAMRCITVDCEDGTFLWGDKFTVTHNSFMSAPFIMARSLLIPSHNTYIMGPTGSQAQETFTKMENLAKNNIASVVGVSSVFLDETARANSKADSFIHDKNSFHVELYNGSTVNTLNSVATNIVGIRSNFNIYDEAGKITRDFFALTMPFTVQNADFRMGGNLNTEIYPRQLQNKNLLLSSAEGIDSELFDRYKIAFNKMMMGDPEYFVCDLDCSHSLHPFLNGKPAPPLVTQDTIDDAFKTNPYRATREEPKVILPIFGNKYGKSIELLESPKANLATA